MAGSSPTSSKSARVTTALTPASANAFDASMERIRAWGWGLRKTRPVNIPGANVSAP